MPCVSHYFPAPMGITPLTGTQIKLGCNILHSYFLPGKLTRQRRTQTYLSTLYQANPQTRRLLPSIFRMYGIRLPIWTPTLSWHILQSRNNTRATPKLRKQKILDRPTDRGPLEPRINLFKGLSVYRAGDEHNKIRSQLRFEKQMELIRHYDACRMGAPVQEALHRTTRSEALMRRTKYKERTISLRNNRYSPGQIQNGWESLEDTT